MGAPNVTTQKDALAYENHFPAGVFENMLGGTKDI
jgi:hypothetical protein